MKIKVSEGWMRGIFVDDNRNEYTYIDNDKTTDKCLFVDVEDNLYIETERDSSDTVCEIMKVED